MTTITMQEQWKPFSLTHITYPSQSPLHTALGPLLALLSLTPPFAVCALTTAIVFYKDVLAAYLLVGCVTSAFITSMLKNVIQEPRPERYDDDIEGDESEFEFGMPSNHSCFAWFGATFIVVYVLRGGRRRWAGGRRSLLPSSSSTQTPTSSSAVNTCVVRLWHHLHSTFAIVASLIIASGCSYSRIYLGYHTPNQVYAGSALGSLLGWLWYMLLEYSVLIQQSLIKVDTFLNELEYERRNLYLQEGVMSKNK